MLNCKACRLEVEEAAGRKALGREAESHLAACRDCRDFVRERAALRSLMAGLGRVSAPEDFDVRLRARMARRRDGGRGRFLFLSNLSFAPAFAVAAAVVFVCAVAAALYLGPGRSAQQPVARQTETPAAPAAAPSSSPAVVTHNQDSTSGEVVSVSQPKQPRARRPVVTRAREAAAKVPARAETGLVSRTYSVGSSRVLVPVGGSADSMRVVLRDENGSARVVPVRSVSFGSQELIANRPAERRRAAKSKEGVW